MTLHLDIRVEIGPLDLDVDLTAPSGAVTAVLGPNGAGKTSLLRVIAGTIGIDRGSVRLDDAVFDAPPARYVVPERRRVGFVQQDDALFPHLTALENVAFGPRSRGVSRREARRLAREQLERAGAGSLASSRPGALSGGEGQRVALARALATEPRVLLLDEPLSALDAGARVGMRRDLHHRLDGFSGPTVLVTHDPLDALALADRVAVIEHGSVTQAGSIEEVTSHPRSRYVADLIGTNLVRGVAKGHTVTTSDGRASFTTAESHDGEVFATIAPAAVALHRAEPEGSPRNRWSTTVDHLDPVGDRIRVQLGDPLRLVAEVTPVAVGELGLAVGLPVWASVKATEIAAYRR